MPKTKLKCFTCGRPFESKKDVFRDSFNYPIHKDCLWEILNDTWDSEYLNYIIDEMEKKHNRNYNKWLKWFHENHILCDGEEHDNYSYYYEHKDNITIIDGKKYCTACIDHLKDEKEGKNVDN